MPISPPTGWTPWTRRRRRDRARRDPRHQSQPASAGKAVLLWSDNDPVNRPRIPPRLYQPARQATGSCDAPVVKQIPARIADDIMRAARHLEPTQLTVDEVSSISGIPRATLYYYFAGRVELVDFIVATRLGHLDNVATAAEGAASDPVEITRQIISAAVTALAEDPLRTVLPTVLVQPHTYPCTNAAATAALIEPLRVGLKAGHKADVLTIADLEVAADVIVGAVIHSIARRGALPAAGSFGDAVADQLLTGLVAPSVGTPDVPC